MSVPVSLSMSGDQHEHLKSFLFPEDGKEAVAILLCGRRAGDRKHRLLVREIHGIPYENCAERTASHITWPPEYIEPLLERAENEKLSILKIHSHPNGEPRFSAIDDAGDVQLLPMIRGWVELDIPHGSAIMLPDGTIFGRVILPGKPQFEPLSDVSVAGDDLLFWYSDQSDKAVPEFMASQAQIFDEGTINRLRALSIAVIGASGTGSPVIEQLTRLGVGELVLVDHDHTECRNINRILNTTIEDAEQQRYKVDVQADAIERMGLGTRVIRIRKNLWHPDVVSAVAQCDILFGCMDSIDGRYLLNAISTFYCVPYFDIGVRLLPDERWGRKGIREVCGTVNYLRPGRSSLMSRGLFSMGQVAEAGLKRNDPDAHREQINDGYIAGIETHRPAVVSVNMFAASLAINEFLARLHPYREDDNGTHAAVEFSLASMELISDPEGGICELLGAKVGLGDTSPLLQQIELTEKAVS